MAAYDELEATLGHSFADRGLLRAALVHRSFVAEHPDEVDNERLEFLGDAVLQLVVTDDLYARHHDLREGQMAKVRAACVNRDELADIARSLDLGKHLILGVGELQSGGRQKSSILADAMEALLAAVYLDAGLAAAARVIMRHWEETIRSKALHPGRRDFKTRFQEILAADGKRPTYDVVGSGPDHARQFVAVVRVDETERGRGTGRSKKEAEQEAARSALEA
jgi:ribonuclease-3